jgi:hypothetical protein
MHPWRSSVALLLVLAASPALPGGVVYKWTDADGVVHLSDQPQPGAEEVPLVPAPSSGNVRQQPNARPPKQAQKQKPPELKASAHLGYTEIAIVTPAPQQAFFDEPIRVSLNLSPDLQQGHTLVWYLNDSPLAETETSFVLDRLDRGTYSLHATISDGSGESVDTNTVTFFVHQPTVLAPQYPKK